MFHDPYARLPLELKRLKQWCVDAGPANANDTDKQGKRPQYWNGFTLIDASSTNPATWMDFETAAKVALHFKRNVGFMLHQDDPFTVVDLDVVDGETQTAKGNAIDPEKWTTQGEFEWFWRLACEADSYTEKSRSGKGLHIFVLAKLQRKGIHKGKTEIYDRARFIICTGNPVIDQPIAERQIYINSLVTWLVGNIKEVEIELVEVEQTETDESIWVRALDADNGGKFRALCSGYWQQFGYPSQSEADLALISMFCFYSVSNAQVRRMFRETVLGKRDKANKDNKHIDRSIRLTRQREKRDFESDVTEAIIAAETKLQSAMEAQRIATAHNHELTPAPLTVAGPPIYPLQPAPAAAQVASMAPMPLQLASLRRGGLDFPPGLIGKVAEFIYGNAPRPVKEVAIVAALGLFAGICGRSFYFSNSGLNLYIILIARSAVGKEAMHSGLGMLCNAVDGLDNFVEFNEFASGQALTKKFGYKPSMINVCGEWGHKLNAMAADEARAGPSASLRKVMTDVYQKSGPNSYVGGISYSNQDDNVDSVKSVAYSMIGESTPTKFYQAMTESMMEDGFMSRFTVVEYDGDRPPLNEDPLPAPSSALIFALAEIVKTASAINVGDEPTAVQRTEEAGDMLREFEMLSDQTIREAGDNESVRQMWNRASLKVMRISSLLAVADNWYTPCITVEYVEWAMRMVRNDIRLMSRKLEGGDVGSGDGTRRAKVLQMCREYLGDPPGPGYKIPMSMHQAGIIPRKYLQTRVQRAPAFTNHQRGVNAALDQTIQDCVANGYLKKVDRSKLLQDHTYSGDAYLIVELS